MQVVDICTKEPKIERLVSTIDMSYQARRRRAFHRTWPVSRLEKCEWHTGVFMVRSMARHKGWKNVYVHLSWPWYDRYSCNKNRCSSSDEARELREEEETWLEQRAMGPDYVADGKYDRRHKWNGYYCTCEECGDRDW
jgi:hypothetical protein